MHPKEHHTGCSVNYEDRTDLEAPPEVVLLSTLARLERTLDESARMLVESVGETLPPPDDAARRALDELVVRDIRLKGAPPETETIVRFALASGYRYARTLLGPSGSAYRMNDLMQAVDRMYVYGLLDYLCPSKPGAFGSVIREAVRRSVRAHTAGDPNVFEEDAVLHWFYGAAVAVVEHSVTSVAD